MKIKDKEIDLKYIGKCVFCIGLGTAVGLITYAIFLYFNLAIFGWNLGLAFAPLAAGYVETIVANKILGKNLGAVSAFILFIDTTYYSFILKNTTLGMNFITAGSIIVILQAAFPTLINYILLVIIGAVLSNFKWAFEKIGNIFGKNISDNIRWETENVATDINLLVFNEYESNQKLNSLNFFFITSTDMPHKSYEIIDMYHSEVIIENKDDTLSVKRGEVEDLQLKNIKTAKDQCLIDLANKIKAQGGNGIVDLDIQYGMIGLGGDHIHVTTTGMGIKLKESQ